MGHLSGCLGAPCDAVYLLGVEQQPEGMVQSQPLCEEGGLAALATFCGVATPVIPE